MVVIEEIDETMPEHHGPSLAPHQCPAVPKEERGQDNPKYGSVDNAPASPWPASSSGHAFPPVPPAPKRDRSRSVRRVAPAPPPPPSRQRQRMELPWHDIANYPKEYEWSWVDTGGDTRFWTIIPNTPDFMNPGSWTLWWSYCAAADQWLPANWTWMRLSEYMKIMDIKPESTKAFPSR